MKSKILSIMDATKKKAGVALLCGALVATIGAGTALAAYSKTSMQVKMENGVRSYSTDGGKTWSEKAPDGVTVSDKDGKVTIMSGTPPKDGEGKGLLSKVENGVRSYSTDGGKTWSTKAPDGVMVSDKDGKFTITDGTPPKDGEGMLSKVENGVRSYSTDGGKTWSTKAPDGVTETETEDGKIGFTIGQEAN
jgi:hypothetical protein